MLLSHTICIGLSHHTAPVDLREKVNSALNDLGAETRQAHDHVATGPCPHKELLQELVILSTCNRAEIYACVNSLVPDPRAALDQFLVNACGIDPEVIGSRLYCYSGNEAAQHLCRVAGGLDSLVLGEPQILGQVTRAYTEAVEAHTAGPVLSTLFLTAMRAGKRARTETMISSNPASMSSMALVLAEQLVGDLSERRVLVIGLGEMGQLTLKTLRARGIDGVAVANRTWQRAQVIATEWGYQAYRLEHLRQALDQSDVVICTTAAPQPIITTQLICEVISGRPGHELVFVDIAVPRDVDPAVGDLPGISVFDVDDLQGHLDEALAARRQEIPLVEAIIGQEMDALEIEYRELAVKPVIADLRQKAETIRQQELERTLRFLGDANPEMVKHVQHLSRALVNKLLHEPTVRLKQRATGEDGAEYMATARDLFGLPVSGAVDATDGAKSSSRALSNA